MNENCQVAIPQGVQETSETTDRRLHVSWQNQKLMCTNLLTCTISFECVPYITIEVIIAS